MRKSNIKVFYRIGLLGVFLSIFTDMNAMSVKTDTFSYNVLSLDEISLMQGGGSTTSGPCDTKTATGCDTACTPFEIGICRNSYGYCVQDTMTMICRCGPGDYIWEDGC